MSHRRKLKDKLIDKERWEKSQEAAYKSLYGLTPSFRTWFIKMIILIIAITTIIAVYVILFPCIYTYALLSIPIIILCFFAHELIHYITARILGYKVEWKPITLVGRFQMEGFDVLFPSMEDLYKNKNKIGIAPYIIMFPYSIYSIIYYYLNPIDLNIIYLISGIVILISHSISIWWEAKIV